MTTIFLIGLAATTDIENSLSWRDSFELPVYLIFSVCNICPENLIQSVHITTWLDDTQKPWL